MKKVTHLHQYFGREETHTTVLAGSMGPPPPPVTQLYSHSFCGERVFHDDEVLDEWLYNRKRMDDIVWEEDGDFVTCEECRKAYGLHMLGELP